MDHKSRFFATIEREPVDRPACWLGQPVAAALDGLYAHFRVRDMAALKAAIGDDVYPIDVPYHHPPSNHIACAFDFAKDSGGSYEDRSLTVPGFFEDMEDPALVETFAWPDPKQHMDPQACRMAAASVSSDYARLGVMWSAHFQDACAAFGMENALVTMLESPDMFRAVIDRIVRFYLEANGIFYEATRGMLDAVLIGNDFGSQNAMMIAPEQLREFVFPGTAQLIDQAHAHGLKVIHHSCGAIAPIIDDLLGLGADALHPIQALAKDMSVEHLQEAYADRASFCGGVDAQNLLVHGTPEAVMRRVREIRELFPTGLIISPSHEAILPDIPPANIAALFKAATE